MNSRRNAMVDGLARAAVAVTLALALTAVAGAGVHASPDGANAGVGSTVPAALVTSTPIQHLVVIYQENESFDHYFGTYPRAANPPGEPAFHAAGSTPAVDGLTKSLLTHNPNGVNPSRFDRTQLFPCDNGHSYGAEQQAFDGGRMDRFVSTSGASAPGCDRRTVMNYYDGNTVTALWNYAQRFSMSDNSHDATFGPTVPGHLNLIAGQTHGAVVTGGTTSAVVNGTVVANATARYEDCSSATAPRVAMSGVNIGDLLSASGTSWGYFSAGFRPSSRTADGTAVCSTSHANLAGHTYSDYIAGAGTEPFQFWASTANPHHLPPRTTAEIGHAGPANHQYDLSDFWTAAAARHMPAVSFIKPPAYANGHPGNSDPLDEQRFLVNTINHIQRLPTWSSTAIVIAYDDSDGWYDHQMTPILNSSNDPVRDVLSGPGRCGRSVVLAGFLDRCGPGPRQPMLVISPYAKRNFVDHTLTTQVSITRFIENNWLNARRLGGGSFDASAGSMGGLFAFTHPDNRLLLLDPNTGLPELAGSPPVGASTSVGLPPHSAVVTATRRAADYYRTTYAHTTLTPGNGWSWATYAQGVQALYRQAGDARYLADGMAWGRSNSWRPATSQTNPDTIKAGQTYFDLHAVDPAASLTAMDAGMAADLTGLQLSQYDWIDALFMGLPNWTRWAARTGNPAYLDKLDAFYAWTRDQGAMSARCAGKPAAQPGLYDAAQGLWYRDCSYVGAKDANGRPVFWARGNGWVIAAMADVLASLPATDPRRAKYAGMLQTMAARLAQLQGSDGMWRASLADTALYPQPETSGTGLITYALAYAIKAGVLDAATYVPVVARAWHGLTTLALQPNGFVADCQGPGVGPGSSYSAAAPRTAPTATSSGTVNLDSPPYCVGAVLLAGAAVAAMPGSASTGRPVAYTAQQVGNEAAHVDDGDVTTRWSAKGFPQAVTVDLGANRQLSNAMVVPFRDRPYRYRIQTSTDNVHWQLAVDRTANTATGSRLDDFASGIAPARYARLTVTAVYGAGTTWVSIQEFAVY